MIAFVFIKEKLTLVETFAITMGIIGTAMLTMPQWFSFLGLDSEGIEARLATEQRKYGAFTYYFGIIIALCSSVLDCFGYFIIRTIGSELPTSMYPFGSGLFTGTLMSIYYLFNNLVLPMFVGGSGSAEGAGG